MKMLRTLLITVLLGAALPASAQDPNESNPVMHSFGAIGAQAVFSTYMSIAELADLFGAKAYDKDKVVQLSTMYGNLAGAAKDSLNDLVDSEKLNADDTAAVKELILINDMLISTSKNITAYAEDPTEENEAAYDKNRQRAWKAISKFLGIE